MRKVEAKLRNSPGVLEVLVTKSRGPSEEQVVKSPGEVESKLRITVTASLRFSRKTVEKREDAVCGITQRSNPFRKADSGQIGVEHLST